MSTEVTPESLRLHAKWLRDAEGWSSQAHKMDAVADDLEREQRPLPTVPGWYPGIVVERGGESCTGALLTDDKAWVTALPVDYSNHHDPDDRDVTIRWAEQDGTTPGQTFWEASLAEGQGHNMVSSSGQYIEDWAHELNAVWHPSCERIAAAVLAAHSNPILTPVGEHPEPGTRGLLPVRFIGEWGWMDVDTGRQVRLLGPYQHTIVTDPRPDGAHA